MSDYNESIPAEILYEIHKQLSDKGVMPGDTFIVSELCWRATVTVKNERTTGCAGYVIIGGKA